VATAVADLLGMSTEEIASERQAGKSLEDIATAKDVSKDDLISAMLEPRRAALDKAVDERRLTEAEAQAMLENMEARLSERVGDATLGPRGAGAGGAGAGCGMGVGNGCGQPGVWGAAQGTTPGVGEARL
jgi:hypothetical protein